MLDEARKDQIGVVFLLKKDTSIKKIRRLNIQEIIFLICSARFFKSKQTIISDNFQKKIDIFTKVLLEKIKNADELFIIYDKNTEYPYIDSKGRIWVFSKEKYAVHVKDYFAKTMSLEVKRVIGQEVVNEFDNFYRLGIEKIIVDNGQYAVEIKRDEILKKFDSKNTLTINIPVENPKLQYSMIRFFQNLYDRDEYKGKKEFLSKLEVKMLDELVSAKYLVPIKVRNGAPIISREQINTVLNKKDTEIASIVSDDDTNWLPAFTDWEEFERIYHKNMWKGYIASYDELMELCSKMSGVVINCRGLALHIDEKNRRVLEQYEKGNEDIIEEKNEEEEEVVEKKVEPKDTQITLSEPEEYPKEMIEAIKEYMRSKKSINKAYLRLMMKNQNKSYLIVIDFSEKDKKVFDEIAEVAIPYLDGKYLDMVQMDKWAKEALVDVKPFYKKKFLGLF